MHRFRFFNKGPSDHFPHAYRSSDGSLSCFVSGTAHTPVTVRQTFTVKSNTLNFKDAISALMRVQDRVDGGVQNFTYTFGRVFDEKMTNFKEVNNLEGTTQGFESDLRMTCKCYVYDFMPDGVRFGTQCSTIPPLNHSKSGYLIIWSRADRAKYHMRQMVFQEHFHFPLSFPAQIWSLSFRAF